MHLRAVTSDDVTEHLVVVAVDDDGITIRVQRLDDAAATLLRLATAAAVAQRPVQVVIELSEVTSVTVAGRRALAGCRSLAARAGVVLHQHVDSGVGSLHRDAAPVRRHRDGRAPSRAPAASAPPRAG